MVDLKKNKPESLSNPVPSEWTWTSQGWTIEGDQNDFGVYLTDLPEAMAHGVFTTFQDLISAAEKLISEVPGVSPILKQFIAYLEG